MWHFSRLILALQGVHRECMVQNMCSNFTKPLTILEKQEQLKASINRIFWQECDGGEATLLV